ncbi:MAG: type I-B CRISPR-associated protein Cas5b [Blastocatellia bacterium]|nr:type I-B CRISPR-associated protein Cas5b [Blastocatellia bacterium]MDW8257489.1 type I-B CRISPR-associated protein Cas5b [Acidobacteriota bacterium]
MNILRLRIYQPQAHYRIPFTYQRRHTYPIPPYSTVIGFLCNVLGINDQKKTEKINGQYVALYDELKKIKIAIAGRFESKTTEYIWFRNLAKSAHLDRFGYAENRSIGGHVEHIGGQSPVSIDVLDDVRLVIYLAHEKKIFLERIKSSLENPVHRLEVLHLGRAEDWIVIEELPQQVFELSQFPAQRVDADFQHFFWIPKVIFANGVKDDVARTFDGFEGLLYNVPTFWTVADFERTRNRHGHRVFEYIQAKLNDGLITNQSFLYDKELNLPILLADFGAGS